VRHLADKIKPQGDAGKGCSTDKTHGRIIAGFHGDERADKYQHGDNRKKSSDVDESIATTPDFHAPLLCNFFQIDFYL
jgi:hypothetical protein